MHIRRIDEHRYEATAPDVIGAAPGEAYGNTFQGRRDGKLCSGALPESTKRDTLEK
jgi:hypothetical protein